MTWEEMSQLDGRGVSAVLKILQLDGPAMSGALNAYRDATYIVAQGKHTMNWETICQLEGPAVSAALNTHSGQASWTQRYDYTISWDACMPIAMAYHVNMGHGGAWWGERWAPHIVVSLTADTRVIAQTATEARLAICRLALLAVMRKRGKEKQA